MKRTVIACLLSVAFTAPVVFAQNSEPNTNGKPNLTAMVEHGVKYLTALLTFTPQQQTAATTILTNAASQNSTVFGQLRTAHQQLKRDIDATPAANDGTPGAVNTSQLESDVTAISTLEKQLALNHATEQAQLLAILSSTQQTILENAEGHGHRGGRFGGPGGPGR